MTQRQHPRPSRRFLLGASAAAAVASLASGQTAFASTATPLLRREPPARPPSQPQRGGTLRYGLSFEPQRMNQLNTTWMTDATQHMYDRLLTRDHDGNYVPHLATWEVSDDKLSWSIRLRPGVKFHNGDPLTAHAIKWWFEQASDPKGFFGFKGSYAAFDSAEVKDDQTLQVKLKHPDAALQFILYTVYSSIHNPKTYDQLGKDDYGVKGIDGTGAFKLQDWTPGDKLVIVRNDDYNWAPAFVQNQGAPYLDSVVYRHFADETARSTAIEAGDLDIVVQPNLSDVDRLKNDSRFTVISKPMPAARVVSFNWEMAPWGDKRVRQAMAHAIQREPMIDRLFFGHGVPAFSLVPPIYPNMYLDETKNYFPFDIAKGKALLAAAGLEDKDGDGFVEFEGSLWEPEMIVTAISELTQLAQVVQAQAARIGIKLKIVQLDAQTNGARSLKGEWGIATGFYLWDGPDTILDWWFHSGNIPSTNRTRTRDSQMDALIEKLRKSGTLDDRNQVTKDIQKLVHGDLCSIIPVYHPLDIYVVSNKVKGYTPNAHTLYPRMHDVWLER